MQPLPSMPNEAAVVAAVVAVVVAIAVVAAAAAAASPAAVALVPAPAARAVSPVLPAPLAALPPATPAPHRFLLPTLPALPIAPAPPTTHALPPPAIFAAAEAPVDQAVELAGVLPTPAATSPPVFHAQAVLPLKCATDIPVHGQELSQLAVRMAPEPALPASAAMLMPLGQPMAKLVKDVLRASLLLPAAAEAITLTTIPTTETLTTTKYTGILVLHVFTTGLGSGATAIATGLTITLPTSSWYATT